MPKPTIESKEYDELPIVRQCCKCKEWLDEESATVANTRNKIEYTISHGYCEPCNEIVNAEIDVWEAEEECPDTERADEIPDTLRSAV